MALYKPKRKDGTPASPYWWFDTSHRGRRHRESTGVRDKKLARELMEQRIAEIRLGRPLDGPEGPPAPRFADYGLEYNETGGGSVKLSARDDLSILNRALIPSFGKKRLDEITRQDVERFRNDRLAGKLSRGERQKAKPSRSTVKAEIALLRRILNVAMEEGLLDRNPTQGVRVPRFNNRRERVVSREEYLRLLAAVDSREGPHWRILLILGWETGMRQGEILGLRWGDVSFQEHVLRLPETKNGEARDVPLTEAAERALREWRGRRGVGLRSTFVFPAKGRDGAMGHPWKAWNRMRARAGVEDVNYHDLRHTFITRMIEAGVDVITLSEITGHKDLKMLQRYSHPRLARKVELVRAASSHTTATQGTRASGNPGA